MCPLVYEQLPQRELISFIVMRVGGGVSPVRESSARTCSFSSPHSAQKRSETAFCIKDNTYSASVPSRVKTRHSLSSSTASSREFRITRTGYSFPSQFTDEVFIALFSSRFLSRSNAPKKKSARSARKFSICVTVALLFAET